MGNKGEQKFRNCGRYLHQMKEIKLHYNEMERHRMCLSMEMSSLKSCLQIWFTVVAWEKHGSMPSMLCTTMKFISITATM